MADESKQHSNVAVLVDPEKEEMFVKNSVVKTTVPDSEPEIQRMESTVEVVEDDLSEKPSGDDKIAKSPSFKEDFNVVAVLPNPQQKGLDELKALLRKALDKHEFTPLPLAPVREKVKIAELDTTVAPVEGDLEFEATTVAEPAQVEPSDTEDCPNDESEKVEEKSIPVPPGVEKTVSTPPSPSKAVVIVEKVEIIEYDGYKAMEDIKETKLEVTTPAPPPLPAAEEEATKTAEPKTPTPAPNEVLIWGVKLFEDEKTDTILLKFLGARDFKVKEAFTMLKRVLAWRKEFGIDELLQEENITEGVENIIYSHGVDKEGHPVIYNTVGDFQNKELYQDTFADEEKFTKIVKDIILLFEKRIRDLDFAPNGMSTLFQVIDLKNSPGLLFLKKDLRQAVNRALQLIQDNYPQMVAKQVYINVPWWYAASYRMISGILSLRTKIKSVFTGPSQTAETLFQYIVPERVPVKYGGLSREGEQEFSTDNLATEATIKKSSKHSVEFDVSENSSLVWEVRVVGWDVTYGAEFVPSDERGYSMIVQKPRKIGVSDETVVSTSYKSVEPGKVVLTFDNQTSKRKKLLYRSKTKSSE